MHKKMQTPYAKRITRIRSKTVEPVLGTLLNYTNMRRVNTRGIKQATKHVLMAALTYNLKKYINFNTHQYISKAMKRIKEIGELFYFFYSNFDKPFLTVEPIVKMKPITFQL